MSNSTFTVKYDDDQTTACCDVCGGLHAMGADHEPWGAPDPGQE